jgi:hypothetical protein
VLVVSSPSRLPFLSTSATLLKNTDLSAVFYTVSNSEFLLILMGTEELLKLFCGSENWLIVVISVFCPIYTGFE